MAKPELCSACLARVLTWLREPQNPGELLGDYRDEVPAAELDAIARALEGLPDE